MPGSICQLLAQVRTGKPTGRVRGGSPFPAAALVPVGDPPDPTGLACVGPEARGRGGRVQGEEQLPLNSWEQSARARSHCPEMQDKPAAIP